MYRLNIIPDFTDLKKLMLKMKPYIAILKKVAIKIFI